MAEFDFTNVPLADPTKDGINDPNPGAYRARSTVSVPHTSKEGGSSIKVTVALQGGGETDLYLGLDGSKPYNISKIKTALASMGVAVEKIGKLDIGPQHFMGRDGKGADCYVIVRAVEGVNAKGQKKLNDKGFATKEQFEAYNAAQGGTAPANGATPAGAATAPAAGASAALAGLFG
jgi:hypothetical protein